MHRGARPIARLTKYDVEALLAGYDIDPVGALTVAMRKVLGAGESTTWPELVALAPITDTARAALLSGETGALDALAAELNEARQLSR